jgi:hypothetical protein
MTLEKIAYTSKSILIVYKKSVTRFPICKWFRYDLLMQAWDGLANLKIKEMTSEKMFM